MQKTIVNPAPLVGFPTLKLRSFSWDSMAMWSLSDPSHSLMLGWFTKNVASLRSITVLVRISEMLCSVFFTVVEILCVQQCWWAAHNALPSIHSSETIRATSSI